MTRLKSILSVCLCLHLTPPAIIIIMLYGLKLKAFVYLYFLNNTGEPASQVYCYRQQRASVENFLIKLLKPTKIRCVTAEVLISPFYNMTKRKKKIIWIHVWILISFPGTRVWGYLFKQKFRVEQNIGYECIWKCSYLYDRAEQGNNLTKRKQCCNYNVLCSHERCLVKI